MIDHPIRHLGFSLRAGRAAFVAAAIACTGFAPVAHADDRCQAQADIAKGDRQAKADADHPQKLADCHGVLAPPSVGDGEMVEPAPQTGSTPVIKPDNPPPQQPGNGSTPSSGG